MIRGMDVIIFFVCLFLELIINIYIYNSILYNIKLSFFRCIIKILYYIKYYIQCTLSAKSNKIIKQFLNDNNGLHYVYYPLFFLVINILYAIFSSVILTVSMHNWFLCLIYGFALLSIYIESLIKYRFMFISYFEKFFIFYSFFQEKLHDEKGVGILSREKKQKIKISISKRKLFAVLLMTGSATVMLYFYLRDIYKVFTGKKKLDFFSLNELNILPLNNKVFMIAFLIFIVSMLVIMYGSASELDDLKKQISEKINIIIQKMKNKKGNTNGRYLTPELKKLEKSINSLCKKLEIDYVNILVDKNIGQPAIAKSIVPPTVILQKSFVEQFILEEEIGKLMFVIGHELVHIKYKDTPGMRREAIKMFIVFFVLVVCCTGLGFMCVYFGLNVIACIIAFAELAIIKIMAIICDPRYLRQVAELRADRIGLEVCGEKADTFKAVMNQLGEDESIVSWKEGLLKWYLMLYEDMDEHPYIKTRIYEIGRGKKWCWKEYLRYCWLMMYNKAKGRGWRL